MKVENSISLSSYSLCLERLERLERVSVPLRGSKLRGASRREAGRSPKYHTLTQQSQINNL